MKTNSEKPAEVRSKVLVVEATPEQVAAIKRILDQDPNTGRRTEVAEGQEYVFRREQRVWEVIFGGGRPFHLPDTLGARYLDYLLHHPNEPISAFDLEVAITPEKGEARSGNSIQPQLDAQARREYRRELAGLEEDQKRAQQSEDGRRIRELGQEMKALESALKQADGTLDTGERARGNVRKAIRLVLRSLHTGGEKEREFVWHLESHLSTGYVCLYSLMEGRIWK